MGKLPALSGEHNTTGTAGATIPSYGGIAYSYIVRRWLDELNHGQEPVEGERKYTLYLMVLDFRHICDNNEELLMQVLPSFGIDDTERQVIIHTACKRSYTKMSPVFRDLLASLRNEVNDSANLEEALEDDENYVFDHLQAVPQGFRDSIAGAGTTLAMPALLTAAACVGTLATNVRLDVHGNKRALNLTVFIVGQAASGKAQMHPVVRAWMHDILAEDKLYYQQEEAYREAKRAARNKKEQPPEQKFPIRYLTFTNTLANIAERLANTGGKHAFSFTEEADEVASRWGSTLTDFSTLIRKAYDNSEYYREAYSADAVNVHIDHIFWNCVMCGTPGALYRVVPNVEDGFQTRIALATTPDNTFAPLEENLAHLTEEDEDRILQIAHLLPLLDGDIVLPEIEETGRQWLEKVRIHALENFDETLARQRIRVCVNAQRVVCCMMLCSMLEKLIAKKGGVEQAKSYLNRNLDVWQDLLLNEQTPEMKANFELIADTMINTNMFYFAKQLNTANDIAEGYIDSNAKLRPIASQNIYNLLPQQFTSAQALKAYAQINGKMVSHQAIHKMIMVWIQRGMATKGGRDDYRKL